MSFRIYIVKKNSPAFVWNAVALLHQFCMEKYIMELALAPCQYCNARYPTGLKATITFCRNNEIISHLVCR